MKFIITALKVLTVLLLIVLITIVGVRLYRQRTAWYQIAAAPPSAQSNAVIGIVDRPSSLMVYALGDVATETDRPIIRAYRDYPSLWRAVYSGTVDIALVTLEQFAQQSPETPKAQLWFPYANSNSDGIVCDPKLNHSDKQPYQIAYAIGSANEYLALCLSNSSEVEVQQVRVNNAEEAAAMLRSGAVQAACVPQPWLGELQKEGYKLDTETQLPTLTEIAVVSSRTFAQRQTTLSRVLPPFFNTVEMLQNQPGILYPSVANASGYTTAQVRNCLGKNQKFLAWHDSYLSKEGSQLSTDFERLAQVWKLSGTRPAPLNNKSAEYGQSVADFPDEQKEKSKK